MHAPSSGWWPIVTVITSSLLCFLDRAHDAVHTLFQKSMYSNAGILLGMQRLWGKAQRIINDDNNTWKEEEEATQQEKKQWQNNTFFFFLKQACYQKHNEMHAHTQAGIHAHKQTHNDRIIGGRGGGGKKIGVITDQNIWENCEKSNLCWHVVHFNVWKKSN